MASRTAEAGHQPLASRPGVAGAGAGVWMGLLAGPVFFDCQPLAGVGDELRDPPGSGVRARSGTRSTTHCGAGRSPRFRVVVADSYDILVDPELADETRQVLTSTRVATETFR